MNIGKNSGLEGPILDPPDEPDQNDMLEEAYNDGYIKGCNHEAEKWDDWARRKETEIGKLAEALEGTTDLLDSLCRIANAEEGDTLKKARATLDKYRKGTR